MNSSIKLQFVRVHLGKQLLDVCVDDLQSGRQRVVQFRWRAKDAGDVPPGHWYGAVEKEVAYQRSQDLKRSKGRLIP